MLFSATISSDLRTVCRKFTKNAHEVFLNSDSKLKLNGLTQYFVLVDNGESKLKKLTDIVDSLNFN